MGLINTQELPRSAIDKVGAGNKKPSLPLTHAPSASNAPLTTEWFNQCLAQRNGEIYLLAIYAKAVRGNIPAHLLKAIKEAINHGK